MIPQQHRPALLTWAWFQSCLTLSRGKTVLARRRKPASAPIRLAQQIEKALR